MAASLKLETLNIWGGRVYGPLMEHVQKQEQKIDIFCFQEVYSTPLNRIHTRDSLLPYPPLHPTNDSPARANVYQELRRALSTFHGHYASSQDRYDIHGPVDYILSFGLAMFVKNGIQIESEGDLFIHKAKNSVMGSDNATLGRNLQNVQFVIRGMQ